MLPFIAVSDEVGLAEVLIVSKLISPDQADDRQALSAATEKLIDMIICVHRKRLEI